MLSLSPVLLAFLCGVIAFALSLALTRGLIVLLPKFGMVDKPDFSRHIHVIPTPRGGGLGFVITFLLVFGGFHLFHSTSEQYIHVIKTLIPLVILVPLGIIDDRFGVSAGIKFLFQILVALLAWYLGCRMYSLFTIPLAPWASCILSVFWIVALINAFNMIDGVDGLAGGVACISAFSMAFVAMVYGYESGLMAFAIFIGAILGFLWFNWYPARLFMGDTGSMFIGYVLATGGIYLNARSISFVSIAVALLACGVPVLDILLAIWRRIFASATCSGKTPSEQPFCDDMPDMPGGDDSSSQGVLKRCGFLLKCLGTADQRHIHHRLLVYFHNNQKKTVRRIYLLAALMGILAIFCAVVPGHNTLLTFIIILSIFSFVINRLATIELWTSTEAIYQNFHSAHVGAVLSHAVNPVFDFLVITATLFLVTRGTSDYHPRVILRMIAVIMAVMMLSRNYRTFWNYCVSDDYFRLLITTLFGFCLGWCLRFLFQENISTRYCLASAAISIALIVSQRLFVHYARNCMISRRLRNQLGLPTTSTSTILWGISPVARFYRDVLLSDITRAGQEQLIGILARQRRFCHSYVYGLKVLGTIDELEAIYAKTPFQNLVLTLTPEAEELRKFREFCQAHGVTLKNFSVSETRM